MQRAKVKKKVKNKIKNKNSWIVIIYILIPSLLILLFDKKFYIMLVNYVSYVNLGYGAKVINSEYAINRVFEPFCRSLMIVVAIILSYIILMKISKLFIRRGIIFLNAKKVLNFFEIIILMFTIIIAVYGKVDQFDYSNYGLPTKSIKEAILDDQETENIPLQKIPACYSINMSSSEEGFLHRMISKFSLVAYNLSDNFELFIAIAGTIIVPFKKYVEEII